MRKLLLIAVSGLFLTVSSKATITLIEKESGTLVPNGTSIQVWGDVTESLITWHDLAVINLTGTTTKINMKRYTISSQSSVEDYFCWYVCLGTVNSSSTPVLNHSAGSCFNSNNGDTLNYFSTYYKPMGMAGTATYRYVWFDVSSPSDSAYFDVTFNVTPVSVPEMNKDIKLSLYPNPATDFINLTIENADFNNENLSVEIFDVIGNKVLTQNLTQGALRLDVSELATGAYICTIANNRKAILTKRVIINR